MTCHLAPPAHHDRYGAFCAPVVHCNLPFMERRSLFSSIESTVEPSIAEKLRDDESWQQHESANVTLRQWLDVLQQAVIVRVLE